MLRAMRYESSNSFASRLFDLPFGKAAFADNMCRIAFAALRGNQQDRRDAG